METSLPTCPAALNNASACTANSCDLQDARQTHRGGRAGKGGGKGGGVVVGGEGGSVPVFRLAHLGPT